MHIDSSNFNFSHKSFDNSIIVTTIVVYYYINTL
jgi:hypothetical protein